MNIPENSKLGDMILIEGKEVKGKSKKLAQILVVSIGHSPAFYVVLVPLEYIPTILPHSTYVIVFLKSYFNNWIEYVAWNINPSIFTFCSFTIVLIAVDIYGLTCLHSEKYGPNMLRALSSF